MMDEPIRVDDRVVQKDDILRRVMRVTHIEERQLGGKYVLPSGQVETFDYAPVGNYRQASAEEVRRAEQQNQLPPA